MTPPPSHCQLFLHARPPSSWCVLFKWTLSRALLIQLLLFCVQALAAPAAPFIIGADADPNDYGGKWSTMVFKEAFRRLGLAVQVNYYPLVRRNALEDSGEIDGDVGRVAQYGAAHPNLVRVEASYIELGFWLYAANSTVRLGNLDELRSNHLQVEYRRGILYCENQLRPVLPAERLSDISTEVQGIKKLLAGRTDLYCDLEYSVQQALNSPEFMQVTRVRKVLSLGSVKIYPYLHQRHATLAPRLASTLKQMQAQGLIEAYRLQVVRELGWTR